MFLWYVCVSCVFLWFKIFLLFACLFICFLKRERERKKGPELGRWEGGKDLEEVVGKVTMIRIYNMK